ncbi:hypothetical protein J6590_101206, partial [Homalodisca vitripennis]
MILPRLLKEVQKGWEGEAVNREEDSRTRFFEIPPHTPHTVCFHSEVIHRTSKLAVRSRPSARLMALTPSCVVFLQ